MEILGVVVAKWVVVLVVLALLFLLGFYPGTIVIWLFAKAHVHTYRIFNRHSKSRIRRRWKKVYEGVARARRKKRKEQDRRCDHNTTGGS